MSASLARPFYPANAHHDLRSRSVLGNNTICPDPNGSTNVFNLNDAKHSRFVSERKRIDIMMGTLRYILRSEAVNRGLEPYDYHRSSKCCDVCVTKNLPVLNKRVSEGRTVGFWSNQSKCQCAWLCPVCAAKKENQRRADITKLIESAYLKGFSAHMVTLTIPHTKSDRLSPLFDKLKICQGHLFEGRKRFRSFLKANSHQGRAQSVEILHGINGWHPHAHEIHILDKSANIDEFRRILRREWVRTLVQKGVIDGNCLTTVKNVLRHGTDIVSDISTGDYLAKRQMGRWGADSEFTKTSSKTGRKGSMTPFDMLEEFNRTKSGRIAKLFIEFVDFIKEKSSPSGKKGCKHQFSMRGNTRKFAGLPVGKEKKERDKKEKELKANSGPDYQVVQKFDYFNYHAVRKNSAYLLLVELLESGGKCAVRRWLDEFGWFNNDGTLSNAFGRYREDRSSCMFHGDGVGWFIT